MSTQAQGLLHTLSRDDLKASLKFFALVLILILVPDRELDGLFGLNPRLVWMAVVFVAELGLLGYLLARVIRPTTAILITGAIGGCFSPNMAVMSLAEQAKRYPEFTLVYTLAAAIASTMLFPKMLVVVGFVDMPLAMSLLIPFAAMTAVGVGVSVLLWFRIRDRGAPTVELKTPFHVRTALVFGAVVAVPTDGGQRYRGGTPFHGRSDRNRAAGCGEVDRKCDDCLGGWRQEDGADDSRDTALYRWHRAGPDLAYVSTTL